MNEPSDYRARLLDYMPLFQKLARIHCSRHPANGDPADFAQDAMVEALRREPRYNPNYAFATWIHYVCLIVASRQRQARMTTAGRARHVDVDGLALPTPASQHDYAELSDTLRKLSGTRDSEVLLRSAMGDTLEEIGAEMGLSKQRVQQLKVRELAHVTAAMAEVDCAA